MVKVALSLLVKAGASSTVSVNCWVLAGAVLLVAVRVRGYLPPVPTAGVPDSRPTVESDTPFGRVPFSVKVGAGNPLAVAVNVPFWPAVNVVEAALVIAGASFTVSVNCWVASGATPFAAVNVIG